MGDTAICCGLECVIAKTVLDMVVVDETAIWKVLVKQGKQDALELGTTGCGRISSRKEGIGG